MNLLKKLFPKYETKADLREKIAYLNGAQFGNRVITINHDLADIYAAVSFRENGVPTEYLKRCIHSKLVDEIDPFIQYDIRDAQNYCDKELIGRITIAVNKKVQ